jgi:hypothetical protein
MESVSSHIPPPSVAWSQPAASQGDCLSGEAASPLAGPHHATDATQLRARLLRMIVDSEHSRKTAATEASNAR